MRYYGIFDRKFGSTLAPREREVMRWWLCGFERKEIAHWLDLSDKTVKYYLYKLYGRLGVSTRTDLVMLTLRLGWRTADQIPLSRELFRGKLRLP